MRKLETNHRLFLMKETIIAIIINTSISFVVTFLMFRSQNAIMFWGKGGLFFDLIPTIFFMTFCMTAAMTPITRGRILKGTAPAVPWHRSEHTILRFLPGTFIVRALVIGIVALLILLPVSTGLLTYLKEFPVSFKEMLVFKTYYGALIGLFFTPIIILGAMADKK